MVVVSSENLSEKREELKQEIYNLRNKKHNDDENIESKETEVEFDANEYEDKANEELKTTKKLKENEMQDVETANSNESNNEMKIDDQEKTTENDSVNVKTDVVNQGCLKTDSIPNTERDGEKSQEINQQLIQESPVSEEKNDKITVDKEIKEDTVDIYQTNEVNSTVVPALDLDKEIKTSAVELSKKKIETSAVELDKKEETPTPVNVIEESVEKPSNISNDTITPPSNVEDSLSSNFDTEKIPSVTDENKVTVTSESISVTDPGEAILKNDQEAIISADNVKANDLSSISMEAENTSIVNEMTSETAQTTNKEENKAGRIKLKRSKTSTNANLNKIAETPEDLKERTTGICDAEKNKEPQNIDSKGSTETSDKDAVTSIAVAKEDNLNLVGEEINLNANICEKADRIHSLAKTMNTIKAVKEPNKSQDIKNKKKEVASTEKEDDATTVKKSKVTSVVDAKNKNVTSINETKNEMKDKTSVVSSKKEKEPLNNDNEITTTIADTKKEKLIPTVSKKGKVTSIAESKKAKTIAIDTNKEKLTPVTDPTNEKSNPVVDAKKEKIAPIIDAKKEKTTPIVSKKEKPIPVTESKKENENKIDGDKKDEVKSNTETNSENTDKEEDASAVSLLDCINDFDWESIEKESMVKVTSLNNSKKEDFTNSTIENKSKDESSSVDEKETEDSEMMALLEEHLGNTPKKNKSVKRPNVSESKTSSKKLMVEKPSINKVEVTTAKDNVKKSSGDDKIDETNKSAKNITKESSKTVTKKVNKAKSPIKNIVKEKNEILTKPKIDNKSETSVKNKPDEKSTIKNKAEEKSTIKNRAKEKIVLENKNNKVEEKDDNKGKVEVKSKSSSNDKVEETIKTSTDIKVEDKSKKIKAKPTHTMQMPLISSLSKFRTPKNLVYITDYPICFSKQPESFSFVKFSMGEVFKKVKANRLYQQETLFVVNVGIQNFFTYKDFDKKESLVPNSLKKGTWKELAYNLISIAENQHKSLLLNSSCDDMIFVPIIPVDISQRRVFQPSVRFTEEQNEVFQKAVACYNSWTHHHSTTLGYESWIKIGDLMNKPFLKENDNPDQSFYHLTRPNQRKYEVKLIGLYKSALAMIYQFQCPDLNPNAENWVETKTEEGKSYFYNAITRETTWNKPRGMNINVITQDKVMDFIFFNKLI